MGQKMKLYGLQKTKKIINKKFRKLYTKNLPNPDILIRTGGIID